MISLRTILALGALLLSLPLGAQNPFLRPNLELGMSSANLRMTQSGSSGPLGGIQGLRAGAGLELSLGPLTYISAGLYYQQLGANNELSRRGSRPLELGAHGYGAAPPAVPQHPRRGGDASGSALRRGGRER